MQGGLDFFFFFWPIVVQNGIVLPTIRLQVIRAHFRAIIVSFRAESEYDMSEVGFSFPLNIIIDKFKVSSNFG